MSLDYLHLIQDPKISFSSTSPYPTALAQSLFIPLTFESLNSHCHFIQASINLFCKVLSSPFDTENHEDLQIIARISQLIQSHCRPMDPESYTVKVRFAAGVTLELKLFVRCAIENAFR